MTLRSQLARWQAAGLIDAQTAQRIEQHEAGGRKPIALYALGALGAGTIALGIVSVIAANWEEISPRVKLGVDLVLAVALAAGTYLAVQRKWRWPSEVLVTVLYGFTLASLSLVGQVYQLDTPEYQALCAWSAVTLPLVLLGRSGYLAVLVLAGLVTTHATAFDALFDHIERMRMHAGNDLMATLLYASPPLYVLAGRIPWLVRERPHYAAATSMLGWAGIALGGFGLQFLWYDEIAHAEALRIALVTTAMIGGGLAWSLPRLYPELQPRARQALVALLAFAWLSLVLGSAFAHGEMDYVGALLQIAWLGLLAWAALQAGRLRTFNLLTAALALRVLVVYFEVFHSLLDTGMGLISGGLLTLLMAWLWRRKTRDVAQRLAPASSGGSDAT